MKLLLLFLAATMTACAGMTNRMPSGSGGIVTVSPTIHQRLERGETNGSPWVALRMDSSLHLVAFGVLLEQKDAEHVEAKVFPADAKKVAAIAAGLESGTLFCDWRELNYPYDRTQGAVGEDQNTPRTVERALAHHRAMPPPRSAKEGFTPGTTGQPTAC
jgi:hypothetical protein